MASNIKGINIKIGGDTVGLDKALSGVNKKSRNLQSELRQVQKLLKLDPKNTELLAQKQKLLSESISNTKDKLKSLKEAEKQVQNQFKKGEVSEEQYRALQREIVKTEQNLKSLETQSQQVNDKLGKISKIASDFGNSAENMGKKMLPLSTAVAGIGTGAVIMSGNFDDAMADINTLLDDESHLEKYKQKVREISDDLNVNITTAADGMYQAISSLGDGTETTDIFSTMAKSAKAGSAETTDAVSLISSAMKGYGTVNDETAKKVSDLAFETAKLGVTTFPEMAKNMQPLFPVANELNVSMEELFGVIATGTGVTGNTSEVTTQFKAVLSNLMKPTKDMSELMQKYGYSNAQAMIESEGLAGVFKILQDETGGQSDKMAKLFSSTEALTLLSTLTGSQFETFGEKVLAMGDAVGATDTAFEKKQTQTEKLRSSINKIKNSAIDLGVALQPVFNVVAKAIEKISSKIKGLTPLQMKSIALIGTIAAVSAPLLIVIGKIATGFGAVIKVFKLLSPVVTLITSGIKLLAPVFTALTSPIGLVVGAITLLVGGFIYLWNTSEGFRNFFIECWENICNVVSQGVELIKTFFTETIPNAFNTFKEKASECFNAVGEFISTLVNNIVLFFTQTIPQTFQNFLNWLGTFFVTDWTEKFGALGLVINLFRDKIKAIFTTITGVFKNLISFVKNIFTGNWKGAWQNVVDIFDTIFNGIKEFAMAPINFVMGLIDGVVNAVKNALDWLSKLWRKKKDVDDDDDYDRRNRRPRNPRMMAKGGVLTNGEAIVAEAGPELIQMIGGRAVVTPLSKSSTNTKVDTAKNKASGGGELTVNVYSPKALTAAETARQFKRVQRQIALGV